MYDMSQDLSTRHASTQHLARLLEPNPNLPAPLLAVSRRTAELRDYMLDVLADGPELTAGLRKLLEAKDCFVRQSLIDNDGAR